MKKEIIDLLYECVVEGGIVDGVDDWAHDDLWFVPAKLVVYPSWVLICN